MASTITINGVGFAASVDVFEGESYTEALERAGLDTEAVDVTVGGAEVDLDAIVPPGDQAVTTSPKNAELG